MNGFKNELKTTMILAYPVVIGQIGHMMMGVVDSLMVGRLGAVPLAGAALANSLFFLILVVGIGFSYAITPYVAMAHGGSKHEECGVVLRQGLIAGLIIGIALTVLVMGMARIIPFINQPEDVVIETLPYLKILGWSVIPVMVFQIFRQYSEGLSIMKPAMVVTIVANILNAGFNWMFIFGHLGFPAMGLKGAGYSTLGTRTAMTLFLVVYVLTSHRFRHFGASLRFRKIDWKLMGELSKLGFASAFQNFFEVGAFAGAAVLIGWFGATQLAAHQITLNMAALTFMFGLGISASASVRVGNAVGKNDFAQARLSGFASIFLAATVMGFFGIIFVTFRYFLPTLYISDPAVIEVAASLLIIAAIFQISDGVQVASLGILRGMADKKFPTLITFIAYWIIGLPSGCMFGFLLDMKAFGVWIGLFLGLTASAILLTYRFHKLSACKQNQTC